MLSNLLIFFLKFGNMPEGIGIANPLGLLIE